MSRPHSVRVNTYIQTLTPYLRRPEFAPSAGRAPHVSLPTLPFDKAGRIWSNLASPLGDPKRDTMRLGTLDAQ